MSQTAGRRAVAIGLAQPGPLPRLLAARVTSCPIRLTIPMASPLTNAQTETGEYPGTELEATAYAHNYTAWVMSELRPFLRGRTLEVGAGIGTVARSLLESPIERLIALEPAPRLLEELRRALSGQERVEIHQGTLPALAPRFASSVDTVVYVNVLEHIADDRAELRAAADVLRPGGHLCVFVPARPWLFSHLDAAMGHHRRYATKGLVRLVDDVGLELVRARNFDALGMVTWLVAFKWLKLEMTAGPVRTYDRLVVPIARLLDRALGHTLGKSLVLIARKPRSA